MNDWLWSKRDDKGVARFVIDNATEWLTSPRPPVNWNDMHRTVQDRELLVKALYETLLKYEIRYTPEKYQPDQAQQVVRRPDQILERPGEGTCLDLSLLFCGVCIGCELIPWLVRVKGHAFVMVSLAHRLRDWRHLSRPEWKRFLDEPLKDLTKDKEGTKEMMGWIDDGRYVAVECTGFARGKEMGTGPEAENRDPDGMLTFDDARKAGRAQFNVPARPLEYAIDLAVARFEWKFPADGLRPARRPSAFVSSAPATRPLDQAREIDDLPYLTDRVRQKETVLDSLDRALRSRSGRPALFLIEGAREQTHHGLVRRLVRFELPEWLRLQISNPCLLDVQVDLPSRDSADFDRSLRRSMGMKLTLRSEPSWDELAAWLSDHPGRVLFKLTFNTSAWLEDRQARIERLLQSWQSCKDLDPARTPIVCVQVVYEPLPPVPWIKRRLWGSSNANDALRDYLNQLDGELREAKKYPAVRAVRLAPLADVTLSDMNIWQEHELVRAFSQGADFTTQINSLFEDTGAGAGLPMDRLLPHVRDWLRPYAKGV